MIPDNSWFSERTKTIMIIVTMTILVGGMAWGYYAAYQWRLELRAPSIQIEKVVEENTTRLP